MKNWTLFSFIALLCFPLLAQQNSTEVYQKIQFAKKIVIDRKGVDEQSFFQVYRKELGLSEKDEWTKIRDFQDPSGFVRSKYQQYHQGLPVIGAIYTLHSRAGRLVKTTGNVSPYISLDVQASLEAEFIPEIAQWTLIQELVKEGEMERSEALELQWSTQPPRLCIIDPLYPRLSASYRLAYEILLEAEADIPIRQRVYLDAHSGVLLQHFTETLTHSVEGIAETKYYGQQTITTDSIQPGEYLLQDLSRGEGVYTRNGSSENFNADFVDEDNYWETKEGYENAVATDAHYCTISYFDYMKDFFSWEGIDGNGGKLISHVNTGDKFFVNAYWSGNRAYFGNGDCDRYGPLTTMDVVGHEFAHGFTQHTSDLVYSYESGALNESISDIFGKALEYYYDRENFNWLLGDRFIKSPTALPFRSLEDPNLRSDPKYYGGKYWWNSPADNGGVHTNSGVLNYWFYLLVEGGSGTNEAGVDYAVPAIGMEEAMQIVFGMQVAYLTPNSQYLDAWAASLEQTEDLFGLNSPQYQSVEEAWRAVGVYPEIKFFDLAIELVESDFSLCPGDQGYVEVQVRNVGEKTYPNQLLDIGYIQNEADSILAVLDLGGDLAPGEFVSFQFATPLSGEEENSGRFNVFLINDDRIQVNNTAIGIVRTSDIDGLDLELIYFRFIKSQDCGDFELSRYTYLIGNSGCVTIYPEDTLRFDLTTDNGSFNISRRQPFSFSPGSWIGAWITIQEGDIPFEFDAYSTELWIDGVEDLVENNNVYEDRIGQNLSIREGYYEDFSDGIESEYYHLEVDENYVKDTLLEYRGNPMLALAGIQENPFFKNCPEIEDFLEVFSYSTTLTYCVDAAGMEEPTFGFSSMMWLNDSLERTITDAAYGAMIKITIDSAGIDYPIIYDQYPQDFIEHTIRLPNDYSGPLEMKILTLSGRDSALIERDFSELDLILLDNIRLFDRKVDPQQYEEGYLVYPNPATDLISIKSEDPEALYKIMVYDNLGRLLTRKENILNQYWFDISIYPAGLYYLSILEKGNIITTRKIVKVE